MDIQNGRITIVAVCDDHYLILLGALIKSIEINHVSDEHINLYIIEDHVSSTNKSKLIDSTNNNLISIFWIKLEDAIPKGLSIPLDYSSYPLNIYMRLFIPFFMAKEIKKVLYLDVDMVTLKDIKNLWEIDLGDNILGAVLDPRIKTVGNSWGGIKNYQELKLDPETKYFNTGLLLINTEKWRQEKITEKIINCIENNRKFANYPDQYGLNVILNNKWMELDSRWNFFCTSEHGDPFIIHYVDRKPIYKTYGNSPAYLATFYHYLSLTSWKGFRPIGESRRYQKKIFNVIKKMKKLFG